MPLIITRTVESGFVKDPENYHHKVVPGGFKNEILFNELEILFSQLSNNSDKFVAGASSKRKPQWCYV